MTLPEDLLPLEYLGPNEWADVADVTGEPGWVRRLAELGVHQGCRLCMLQPGSTCLFQVGGCRLHLRGDLADANPGAAAAGGVIRGLPR